MKNKINLTLAVILAAGAVLLGFQAEAQSLDTNASTVKWTGYHLAKSYEHSGFVKVKSGSINIEEGVLKGGNIIISMESLSNTDLEKAKDNAKLVKDLKSERFFNVEEYPEASLKITKITKSGTSYNATGDITIRGITKSIEFTLTESSDGKSYDGKLEIDRIEHEVMYGWSVENAMLSNNFDLDVHIVIAD